MRIKTQHDHRARTSTRPIPAFTREALVANLVVKLEGVLGQSNRRTTSRHARHRQVVAGAAWAIEQVSSSWVCAASRFHASGDGLSSYSPLAPGGKYLRH